MDSSTKTGPRLGGALSWITFGVLGLAAAAGGVFLPQSLPSAGEAAPPQSIPAAAETNESLQYAPPTLPDLPSLQGPMVRLVSGTFVVLILCVFTIWIGKRWIRPLAASNGENKQLRLVEALPLAGRCTVYLLQAGEAKFLAGVDRAGLQALTPLPQSFEGALSEESEREA